MGRQLHTSIEALGTINLLISECIRNKRKDSKNYCYTYTCTRHIIIRIFKCSTEQLISTISKTKENKK